MKNNDIEKTITDIYNYFSQHGEYGSHGVAQTSLFLRKIFSFLNTKEINRNNYEHFCYEIFKRQAEDAIDLKFYDSIYPYELIQKIINIDINNKFSYKQIAETIDSLANKYITKTDTKPTDSFSTKVMTVFAKMMSQENIFIDPCVGTGKLLTELNGKLILGNDIDPNLVEIAKARLYFTSKYKKINFHISQKDGITLPDRIADVSTYIFDPPLNQNFNSDKVSLYSNFVNNYNYASKNIPSEYAFLSTILNDPKACIHYVCIFSSQLLETKENFKRYFRKYLIENSLNVVISMPNDYKGLNKIILAGSNDKKNKSIYLVTPKSTNIKIQDIEKIAEICIRDKYEQLYNEKEYFDIAKIQKVSIGELYSRDYIIKMPVYHQDEKYIEVQSLDTIANELIITNSRLEQTSKTLETYINNLTSGNKNTETTSSTTNNFTTQSNNWFDTSYSDLNNAISIFSNNKEISWTKIEYDSIPLDSCESFIRDLRLVFQAKRLRYKNGYFEIYSKQNLPRYKENNKLSYYIIENNENNKHWQNLTKYLSDKQKDFLNDYIKLYFDFEESENNKSEKELNIHLYKNFEKYSYSEQKTYITTLFNLGLLYNNPNIDEGFEKYIPYFALLNNYGGDK